MGTHNQLASEALPSLRPGPCGLRPPGTTDEAVSSAASHKLFAPAGTPITIQGPRFDWGSYYCSFVYDYSDCYCYRMIIAIIVFIVENYSSLPLCIVEASRKWRRIAITLVMMVIGT